MVQKITVAEAFRLDDTLFLDGRTPKEYSEDHIIGAVNVPLLDDQERHEIGIIYKQSSREKAIERGMELFPRKIPSIYNAVKDHKNKTIIIYCARGGMRSGIIASLLASIGFKVLQLESGYKQFRHYILDELNNLKLKPKMVCLYGLTCSRKTKLIQKFENSLDLEELAQHRGSLYGGVGLDPSGQKKFENLLLKRLKELNGQEFIITEGESRKIGDVEIPSFLFKAMKKGVNILVTAKMENRIEEVVKEYFSSEDKVKEVARITPRLKDVISNKRKEEVVNLIEDGKYREAVKILLEEYYDILYSHTLKNVKFDFEVSSDDLDKAEKEIGKFLKKEK